MIHQGEAGDAEEGVKQADDILYCQDDAEFPEGVLKDLYSTEGCGGDRHSGGMESLGDGCEDSGEGPLQSYLDGEVVIGLLLKKRGVQVACRGGRLSDR